MIHKKKISSTGKFPPSIDKDNDVQSGDIVMIASEARMAKSKFKDSGEQAVLTAKLPNEEERTIWLNQTSINNLVDKYGEDDKFWVGKPMKVLIGLTPQGKTMLILKG
jgi:hypothetical protein